MNAQEILMISVAPPITRDMPVPETPSSGSLAPWQAKRVLSYIEANLETKLRAADLAVLTRFSVGHFSRAFRISFGKPPHAFVMARRVERAKQLILSKDPMLLVEVARRCGLSDQAHLSRMFRKVAGHSPSAWRRRYWSPRSVVESRQSASCPN
jgi:transcriptional regulator GlxA family with amidase domain